MLWFEVMKPMASEASGRQAAHSTIDRADQRNAVADWMYWRYLAELLNAALAEAPVLAPA
ncbi:hypothetical protein MSTO_40110 [Mycobacterium stomatepiae]|uniref:Uncharacterized protein n=1 Tax=Mycobacterium stomatepiae TaxID=470076 RepID=A0A7I7QCP6_9MYCO|nr:hypothetical protein [Mycobacterium stomatepiae]BBY23806.1 hypothetical protein MSTO_40110 [Mycobacterium stomatepiae]